MNLEISVDKLYETGWNPAGELSATSETGLERLPDGRLYPSVGKIKELFAGNGFALAVREVQLFDCYRAVWTDRTGAAAGAVVGADEREASVYALAQMRRESVRMESREP